LRGAHTIPSVSRLRLALPSRIPVLGGRPPYHRIAETRRACVACGKCRRNSSPHENCCCWIRTKPRNRRKNLRRPKDKNNHNVRYLIPGGGSGIRTPLKYLQFPPEFQKPTSLPTTFKASGNRPVIAILRLRIERDERALAREVLPSSQLATDIVAIEPRGLKRGLVTTEVLTQREFHVAFEPRPR
jgi:hypothetical protein